MKFNTTLKKFTTVKPTILSMLEEKFGVNWDKGLIVTCGDMVHCKNHISPHKIVHENTHVEQQSKMDVVEWWAKYIHFDQFRLEQEVEAYRNEALYITVMVKDRNLRFKMIHQIYTDLSSSMYGNICTYSEAKELIGDLTKA